MVWKNKAVVPSTGSEDLVSDAHGRVIRRVRVFIQGYALRGCCLTPLTKKGKFGPVMARAAGESWLCSAHSSLNKNIAETIVNSRLVAKVI